MKESVSTLWYSVPFICTKYTQSKIASSSGRIRVWIKVIGHNKLMRPPLMQHHVTVSCDMSCDCWQTPSRDWPCCGGWSSPRWCTLPPDEPPPAWSTSKVTFHLHSHWLTSCLKKSFDFWIFRHAVFTIRMFYVAIVAFRRLDLLI